jgi:hypothetical protein
MTSDFRTAFSWLLGSCPVTYDDWSDEYIWDCMMRMDGRYGGQKVPDEVGEAISWHHQLHHDSHPAQTQDWCIGVRKDDYGIGMETICSHEVEDDDDMPNDWRIL